MFAMVPGAAIGSAVGSSALMIVVGAAAGVAIAFFGSMLLSEYAGRAGSGVYFSSGASTRGQREYSLADSLIVRGRLDDAIAELEQASARYPEDPEPALRLARLLRDRCDRPADAIRWFRTAVERAGDDAGVVTAALREIIEIHTHVMREPLRALPDLARLASRYPDSPTGTWARREMAELKQSMRDEEGSA